MVMDFMRPSRACGAWVTAAGVGVLFLSLVGCGPSLSDRPTDFHGDGAVEVSVICGDTTVGAKQSDAAWIKTVVKARPGAEVDWPDVRLTTEGVKVVRRAAGRVIELPNGDLQRTVTYWAVATASIGSAASFGPIDVRYKRKMGEVRNYSHGECPLTVD